MIERREALSSELVTILDYIRWAASRFTEAGLFFGHGTDNAWDDATQLVLQTLHMPEESPRDILQAKTCLTERKQLLANIERRLKTRVPTAYITGKAKFCGLPFQVNEHVLVPRSPIGELIEQGFDSLLPREPDYILDLCTGSGCIGIACAYAFAESEVDLSDISPDAIAVANLNINDHDLAGRVNAFESDLFEGLAGKCYDLIVTNPPYVDAEDLAAMPEEFHQEPEIALGSGFDGLDFTRRLLMEAANHLSDDGVLIVEVGNSWVHLEEAFPEVDFTWIEFERGGHGVFMLTREQLVANQPHFQ